MRSYHAAKYREGENMGMFRRREVVAFGAAAAIVAVLPPARAVTKTRTISFYMDAESHRRLHSDELAAMAPEGRRYWTLLLDQQALHDGPTVGVFNLITSGGTDH